MGNTDDVNRSGQRSLQPTRGEKGDEMQKLVDFLNQLGQPGSMRLQPEILHEHTLLFAGEESKLGFEIR